MHTTSTQAVALDVVGRPALAALTMAVEAAAAPVAAAAATARRAAGPRRRVATTLLHPRRLIGRWLDASGASEALCGTTSPAGEGRECESLGKRGLAWVIAGLVPTNPARVSTGQNGLP